MDDKFYSKLPVLEKFIDITDETKYADIPEDWLVIITDIENSTKAIEEGRYKEVNMLGASSIVALININKSFDIPFVFGGDGATILIPPTLYSKAYDALQATMDMAESAFNMKLRVGIVPVQDIVFAKHAVKVAKFKVSNNYSQAMFTGGGLNYAEKLVKYFDKYLLNRDEKQSIGDFSGLECRWQDIKSQRGETVSLLVMATGKDAIENRQIYKNIIEIIEEIYGDEVRRNPVTAESLNLTLNTNSLNLETEVRNQNKSSFEKQIYKQKIRFLNLATIVSNKLGINLEGFNFDEYKQIVESSTDSMKFDDTLRMVISGTSEDRNKLETYLENLFKEKKLAYGLHVSDRALMTCLVFERNGAQVHFVDGADGGYALAAKVLKSKLIN